MKPIKIPAQANICVMCFLLRMVWKMGALYRRCFSTFVRICHYEGQRKHLGMKLIDSRQLLVLVMMLIYWARIIKKHRSFIGAKEGWSVRRERVFISQEKSQSQNGPSSDT
jgi:hypothetical protein